VLPEQCLEHAPAPLAASGLDIALTTRRGPSYSIRASSKASLETRAALT